MKIRGVFRCGACLLWALTFSQAQAAVSRFEIVGPPALRGEKLAIDVLSDTLIHFEISTEASSPIPTTPMVLKSDYPGPTSFAPVPHGFETAKAKVVIDPDTLCIQVTDLAQDVVLTTLCPGQNEDITLTREQTQNIYGLGEQLRNLGSVNGDWMGSTRTPGGQFGNSMVAFGGGAVGNAQFPMMYALGPAAMNYGLFLDDVYALSWDFSGDLFDIRHSAAGKPFRGYFILGRDVPELRAQYMDLVGHPLVPPKKAFGLWVSEFGYRNWGQIDDHIKTLREKNFPVDGFVLDLYWYGGYTGSSPDSNMGVYDWDLTNFPDPKQKIATYDQQSGIGLMLIEESYVSQNKKNFSLLNTSGYLAKEGSANGPSAIMDGWWGHGGMLDWTKDQAGAYWHDIMRKPLTDVGVTFHWTDLGEPEEYNGDNWYAGFSGYGNSEEDVQNLYNFKWDQSIADGYSRNHESQRHFIMSRSGAPGIQRFGAAMWSGDIGSNMESLSSHLNAQMQMSLSGMDYYGADVGGFHREALIGDLNEVYTRWLAHASLFDVPVRPHTDDGDGKNFTAPDRIGDLNSNLFSLRQRYELAPYYYSVAHQAYESGAPLVPPLVYYFQEDPNVRVIAEEKMIGPSLLVATSATLGETNRGVYLPAGDWVNYHTHEWYHSSGQWFANFPLYVGGVFELPVIAKAGAIIPKAKVDKKTMNMLGKRTDGSVETSFNVEVFSSQTPSSFVVTEDDGVSEAYRSGQLSKTAVSQQARAGSAWVNIAASEGTYQHAPATRSYQVQWVGDNHPVKGVKLNGRSLVRVSEPIEFDLLSEAYMDLGAQGVLVKSAPMSVADAKTFEFDY